LEQYTQKFACLVNPGGRRNYFNGKETISSSYLISVPYQEFTEKRHELHEFTQISVE